LLGERGKDKINCEIVLEKEKNRVVIKRAKDGKGILFEHAPKCPVKLLASTSLLHLKVPQPLVRLAISILIENEKREVFITRRAPDMRTFPNVWVLPGGHFESGDDSFAQAVARELKEETGIVLKEDKIFPFILYESVFPVLLELGNPTRHHLVVYMRAKVNSNEVSTLKFQHEEVGAAAWVDKPTVQLALKGGATDETFLAWTISENTHRIQEMKVSQLEQLAKDNSLREERLSTGTRIVLREWLAEFDL